jgi:Flp pilus assembly pilin Flp
MAILRRGFFMTDSPDKPASWWSLLKRIHREERGAVSIETILVVAAIAIPVLVFILKFGWPKIRDWFNRGMNDLDGASTGVKNGTPQ